VLAVYNCRTPATTTAHEDLAISLRGDGSQEM
jgi:hypothetical protein